MFHVKLVMSFESLISMIQQKNKKINIISKKMYQKDQIRERHIIDSAQIIDFVDLNYNTTSDLGTGGGMPGLNSGNSNEKNKK